MLSILNAYAHPRAAFPVLSFPVELSLYLTGRFFKAGVVSYSAWYLSTQRNAIPGELIILGEPMHIWMVEVNVMAVCIIWDWKGRFLTSAT